MRRVPAVLAIVAVLLSTVSAWADSITIAGKTYLNVKVFESASRYYFRDENGRVVSVSKSEVRPGEVNIGSATDPETSSPEGNPVGRIAPSSPIPGDGHTFSVEGYHGGYFSSNRGDMDAAFAKMFDLLEKSPSSRISLEIEAYTLERMLQGGSLECEKSQEAYQAPELLKRLRDAVMAGQIEIVGGTYSQPLWSAHDGEGWVRQFLFGTRAVKKALGVDVKTY
ncbi:MAG: hypothetical protein NTZ09_08490, partial [Candidatus Hydrogenedentes bacterium]|nr:hypothetical protein [Candidatus Hydrogenedentota bacterium]